jgi:hypothetical protein
VKTVIAVLVVLGCAWPASAQTVDSYLAKYFLPGAQLPIQTETFLATSTLCNQANPPSLNTVNPVKLVWDDPANAGKVCIFTDAANGPLHSLPIPGTYEGTLVAVNNVSGPSGDSNRAPFTSAAVIAAPANFRIGR